MKLLCLGSVAFTGFLFSCIALIIVGKSKKYAFGFTVKLLFISFLALSLYLHFSNLLECLKITAILDPYGDFLQILQPLMWCFFLYAYMSEIIDKKLNQSKGLYRRLVETMNDGLIIQGEDNRITYVNDKFINMLGYSRDEIIGYPLSRFLDDKRQDFLMEHQISKKNAQSSCELIWIGKDDRKIPTLVSPTTIFDTEGKPEFRFLVVTDIADRKRIKNLLIESETKYSTLVEQAHDGVCIVQNEIFTFVNRTMAESLGYTVEELVGRSFLDIVAPEYKELLAERHAHRLAHNQTIPSRYEIKTVSKNGALNNVEISVGLIQYQGRPASMAIARDITERKKTEEEHIRLATAIEQIGESVIINDNHMIIRYVNPGFEYLSGYSQEEVIGENISILESEQSLGKFQQGITESLKSGKVWKGHIITRNKGDKLCEVDLTISPIKDKSGKIISYVNVLRDVTHLMVLEKRLRQAQKMEAIGTLAGGIAHDFNNILAAIVGYSELSLDDIPEESPVFENLLQILKSSQRAASLIKQILTFSRHDDGNRENVHAGPIIKEALKMLRATIPKTIEIRQSIDDNSGIILADPIQIHQIIINLCTNAAYAMREGGGVLEVELSEINLHPKDISLYPNMNPGKYLSLRISDTGHGIDPEIIDRIYDPFFSTKGKDEGTGMGLSVVHGIVENYGGMITVSSKPVQGTTFTVFFPKVDMVKEPAVEPISSLSKGKGKILFVDDEKCLVDTGQRMLKHLGYDVVAKTDSLEALKSFCSQPDIFDLVITDQTMPHMTGTELAKELIAFKQDIPIILCTGFSETITKEKAQEIGIREFLLKPFTLLKMADVILTVLQLSKQTSVLSPQPLISYDKDFSASLLTSNENTY